ncbi:MAG TPA: CBS domain-containing protein [Rhodospirillales bacterium]|nr:CBS domain-containing protein [Rhodospirillales bacterium]
MHHLIIPDVIKETEVRGLKRSDTAHEAARLMKKLNISALIVSDDEGKLIGIVTERDLTRRIIAEDKNPLETTLGDIMTGDPETLAPTDSAGDALELMRTRSFRHLPVVDDGRVIGMVSIRDLYSAVKSDLEDSIRETEAYVFGDRYGA